MKQNFNAKEFYRGLKDSIPMLLALLPFGLILGAQAITKGMSSAEITAMMAFNFAGSSEFAAVDLWNNPVPILSIILLTFLLNSRYILLGAAFSPYLKHLPVKKSFLLLALMADENWALSMQDTQKNKLFSPDYYLGSGVGIYILWIAAGLAGALLGAVINVQRWELEIAVVAIFIVIIRGMFKSKQEALPWLISFIVSATIYKIFATKVAHIIIGTGVALSFAYFFPKKDLR